jgi:hypothetical protein
MRIKLLWFYLFEGLVVYSNLYSITLFLCLRSLLTANSICLGTCSSCFSSRSTHSVCVSLEAVQSTILFQSRKCFLKVFLKFVSFLFRFVARMLELIRCCGCKSTTFILFLIFYSRTTFNSLKIRFYWRSSLSDPLLPSSYWEEGQLWMVYGVFYKCNVFTIAFPLVLSRHNWFAACKKNSNVSFLRFIFQI